MAIKLMLSGDIHLHFHGDPDSQNNGAIAAILQKLDLVLKNQTIMATEFAQLKTDFADLKESITIERQQILDKLAAAEAKAASLEADLAKAGTDEERTALHAEMREAIQVVKDIIPDTPPVEG